MLVIKTDAEKATMIAALEKSKEKAPEYTMFGDNNHEGINAQILAIEEEWDEDRAWDEYPDEEDDSHTREMVIDAINWLNGSQEDDVLLNQW